MLRKWILSAVAGVTLLTPLAAVPAAQAAKPEAPREAHHDRDRDRDHDRWRDHDRDHWRRCFEVMYRPCCDAPWSFYGRFDDRWDAERAEHYLRGQGYEAFVRD
jgi:Ni/Co efflux regulator RcnB